MRSLPFSHCDEEVFTADIRPKSFISGWLSKPGKLLNVPLLGCYGDGRHALLRRKSKTNGWLTTSPRMGGAGNGGTHGW